jgi:hypothetical protein
MVAQQPSQFVGAVDGMNERERVCVHVTDADTIVVEAEGRLQGVQVEYTQEQAKECALLILEAAFGVKWCRAPLKDRTSAETGGAP